MKKKTREIVVNGETYLWLVTPYVGNIRIWNNRVLVYDGTYTGTDNTVTPKTIETIIKDNNL
jgi:hypothetical protein